MKYIGVLHVGKLLEAPSGCRLALFQEFRARLGMDEISYTQQLQGCAYPEGVATIHGLFYAALEARVLPFHAPLDQALLARHVVQSPHHCKRSYGTVGAPA
eukprot:CAMPEP_0180534924 /NCGR_PEP_ID=MMETSP1036_2-20121128/64450_1 /TAXON_ID=632150 /ORGANISM="Azadinium spinosum, Strain 3D9" /LENGTH=100 /DNA_ID=CAMNT_0022549301 /DNA_START=59 /DNA_END=358 /DNA_ORIENTATION=-